MDLPLELIRSGTLIHPSAKNETLGGYENENVARTRIFDL